MPAPWRRSIDSLGRMNGASSAMNSEAGEISTAVSPLGTTCSPNVISRNGAATAVTARITAHLGRSRRSRSVGPASARERSTANRTAEASRQRSETIAAAEKPVEGVLDQQVGATPDRREHGEQRGVATGHAWSVGARADKRK